MKNKSLKITPWFNDPITRLGLMNFFTVMMLTMYRSYLAIYLTTDLIVSALIFTIIVSSINFFQIFMRIPMGNLSQVIGRKKLILIGNFSIVIALFMLFIAPNYIIVFVSSLLIGIGMSCYWPASFSYIQDRSNNNYGRNNGRIFKFGDVGILLSALYAKIFLDQLLLDLRLFFLTLAIIGLIAIILFSFLLPETLEEDHRVHTTATAFINENFINMIKKFKEITIYPGMYKIYALQFCLAFTEFVMPIFFPLLLINKGYSAGTVGGIIFGATFFLLWLKPYLGSVSDRFGYRMPVLIALLVISGLYILMPFINNLLLFVVFYFIIYCMVFISFPAVNSGTANTSPDKQLGLALGTLGVYTSLGRTSSTVVMSPIWKSFNISDTFIIAGIMIALLVIILYFFTKSSSDHKLFTGAPALD